MVGHTRITPIIILLAIVSLAFSAPAAAHCSIGQTNCTCGYGALCGASTYCDTSSQLCLPACQQGITTGSCICMSSGSPYMLWWGVCPRSQTCGGSNQTCCSGNTCNSGLACQSGTCRTPPPACGALNQICCSGSTCNSNLTCQSGTCQTPPPACGSLNQTCCAGSVCNSNLTCQSGICRVPPPPCGGPGQACCSGNTCNSTGYSCRNATHTCQACGLNGGLCCPGNTCGLNLVCTSGYCNSPQCSLGQANCTCVYNPSPCGANTYCDPNSQTCFPACQQGVTTGNCMCMVQGARPYVLWWGVCGTPACGGNNQSCCTSGPAVCNSGLGCVSGKCTPKCSTGQNSCMCGYNPTACSATTYCDTSSQMCLPACQQGVLTGSCLCLSSGSPYVLWWGVCPRSQTCGGSNQTCCSGNTCNSGLTCQSGTCRTPPPACGALNQTCCSNSTCNSNLTCQSGTCQTPPPACGSLNQTCCAGSVCNSNLTCQSGICNVPPCGGANQTCCAGNTCNSNLTCQSGICAMPQCGLMNQTCCAGSGCSQTGTECSGSDICVSDACGANTQLCCAGATCNAGLVCSEAFCQTTNATDCGWYGAACCGATHECYVEYACTDSGFCMPFNTTCGGANQTCCAESGCTTNLTCQSGICKVPPCGGANQTCCANSTCTASGYACNTTSNICSGCGASAGQLCCNSNGNYSCASPLLCNTTAAVKTCYSCGGANQTCCGGSACDANYTCQSGICKTPPSTACGEDTHLCCAGLACNTGFVCAMGFCQSESNSNVTNCGWYGAACCGTTHECYVAYTCTNGTCLP